MDTTQYVAFLRAVNVGGRVVKMTELKKIFDTLGLHEVSTFIASGNVIFRSPTATSKLDTRIESALQRTLGYSVVTMVRTTRQVADVAEFEAFSVRAVAGATLYVGFMRTPASPTAVRKALTLQTDIDELRVHRGEIYWLARKSIAESSISMASIEKALQTAVTFRNMNTVRRLATKYPHSQ
jgi:uncharacterized protein (DUF1697 family)